MAPYIRGAWAFGPGGWGSFGLQGGAWDLLPKVGAGPPWDPPKVTYVSDSCEGPYRRKYIRMPKV